MSARERVCIKCPNCGLVFDFFEVPWLLEDHMNTNHGPTIYFVQRKHDSIMGITIIIIQSGELPFLPVNFPARLRPNQQIFDVSEFPFTPTSRS